MRRLLIGKDKAATPLPILDGLIADIDTTADNRGSVTGMAYMVLRSRLSEDLTLVQYDCIARDAEQYWTDCLLRHGHDVKMKAKMIWVIRQYLLRQYFFSGLFLDDIRNLKDLSNYMDEVAVLPYLLGKWTVVRSFEEFVHCIGMGCVWEQISFDHDLGEDKYGRELPSGYDALKWLVEHIMNQELPPPQVLCHSQNPVGKANILGYWESFRKASRR